MARQGRPRRRVKLATLLAVGEGPADRAFINHLKGLYSHDSGQKVTVDTADGGSPAVMIQHVIRKYRYADYDRRLLLLDEDIPIDADALKNARQGNIELIISKPVCLEGMLLCVLGQQIPNGANADHCKATLYPQLAGKPTDRNSYGQLFPRPVIDGTDKPEVVRLRKIVSNEH